MNKILTIIILSAISTTAIANQCQELATQQATDMRSALAIKYAMQTAGCGYQVQTPPPPVQSPPQYVPSSGQWCQVVNGVMNCWGR